jgi:hypothetical protein
MSPKELAELNHAVALAEGWKYLGDVGTTERNNEGKPWCLSGGKDWWLSPKGHHVCGACEVVPHNYAEDGAEAMRLLEKYELTLWMDTEWCCMKMHPYDYVRSAINGGPRGHEFPSKGETPAIAICRAVVALHATEAKETPAVRPTSDNGTTETKSVGGGE